MVVAQRPARFTVENRVISTLNRIDFG